jgi:TRAP-type mannitol/chloroaromatic compound transport system permease large subunit
MAIMITIYLLVRLDPARAPRAAHAPFVEKMRMLKVVGPMLFLFAGVTGVIYAGMATPTEASAVGAFGAFVIATMRGSRNRYNFGPVFWKAAPA